MMSVAFSGVRPTPALQKPKFAGTTDAAEPELPVKKPDPGDDYSRYRASNTVAPPALYHALIDVNTQEDLAALGYELEQYLRGERYRDIPWVNKRSTFGEVGLTVFDVETTGAQDDDRIIQLAAVPLNPDMTLSEAREVNTRVHPGNNRHGEMFPIHPQAFDAHGIAPEDLEGQPEINDLLPSLRRGNGVMKERGLLVAYNAKFDAGKMNLPILKWNRNRAIRQEKGSLRPVDRALVLDPYLLMQRIHPYVSVRKRLEDHYQLLMGQKLPDAHDALADVTATIDVLKYAVKYLEKHTIPLAWAEAADKILEKTDPNWKDVPNRQKTGRITRLIRQQRPAFEAKFGPSDSPLPVVDVLRFQFGGIPTHENAAKPYLPVLDVGNLNDLGVDGEKKWDGTDRLDAAVVEQVRRERDSENRRHEGDEGSRYSYRYIPVEDSPLIDPAILKSLGLSTQPAKPQFAGKSPALVKALPGQSFQRLA